MKKVKNKRIAVGVVSAVLCLSLLTCACGKKEETVESTTAPSESPVEEITLTTSPAKENTNDGGIDGHLPAVDTSDEYVILSGHSLE